MSRILRRKTVIEKTGLSKSTMYEQIEAGNFPQPVRLSARSVGWRESEVDEWIQSRPPVSLKKSNDQNR